MAEPQAYKKKLAELIPKRSNFQPTSPQEAQQAIAEIEKIETFLIALNNQVDIEIQRVQEKFKQAKKASGGTLLATFFNNNGEKAAKIKALDEKRTQLVTNYTEVKSLDKRLLGAYGTIKQQLVDFIEHELGRKPKRFTASLGGLLPDNSAETEDKEVKYRAYLQSKEWKAKAEAAKIRAGNRCQGCNRPRSEVQLEAHHRTYERIGKERPGDITVLCRDCHQSIEVSKAKISLAQKIKEPECGACIRCGAEIPFDVNKPLCKKCYSAWYRFKSYTYEEKLCHACGQPSATSMARPFCLDCYKDIKMIKTQ